MRWRIAAFVVLFAHAAAAAAQEPLTVTAALDEAISSNADLLALRHDSSVNGREALARAARVLAEVRMAHAEVVIARTVLALYAGQAPTLKEMANAAALRTAGGEMTRHDPAAMLLDMARLASARITAEEQARIAELRLNALLGRRMDATIGPLAAREPSPLAADAVTIALAREPMLAVEDDAPGASALSGPAREAMATGVRRRVLEARARVDAAHQRSQLMTTTVLPQVDLGFEHARAAYTANQGGFLELLDAHHRQVDAQIEAAQISAAYERALVALDVAIGETPERLALAVAPARTR